MCLCVCVCSRHCVLSVLFGTASELLPATRLRHAIITHTHTPIWFQDAPGQINIDLRRDFVVFFFCGCCCCCIIIRGTGIVLAHTHTHTQTQSCSCRRRASQRCACMYLWCVCASVSVHNAETQWHMLKVAHIFQHTHTTSRLHVVNLHNSLLPNQYVRNAFGCVQAIECLPGVCMVWTATAFRITNALTGVLRCYRWPWPHHNSWLRGLSSSHTAPL